MREFSEVRFMRFRICGPLNSRERPSLRAHNAGIQ